MDILGGVPTQEYSDIPEAEDLLGGSDPGRLFRRKKTILDTAKEAIDPRNIIGAGEALLSIGSGAVLAPASMLYALRPGQKTQGSPLEFATRNMYLPRTESGIRHLEGLGEVLEQLPQTGPLPELQAFTGMTKGMGTQAAQKAREARSAIAPAVAQGAENLLESQGLLMRAAPSSPKMQAPASDLGFYDPVYQTALNIQRKEGPGQAFLNELQRGENVNKEFLEQSGIAEKLRTTPKITREEVQELAKGAVPEIKEVVKTGRDPWRQQLDILVNRGYTNLNFAEQELYNTLMDRRMREGLPKEEAQAKFQDYTLPGGENYREVLLTMPEQKPSIKIDGWTATVVRAKSPVTGQPEFEVRDKEGNVLGKTFTAEDSQRAINQMASRLYENIKSKINYKKVSHWDEPNVVAHIRMNDRTDSDGKKVLFVEELQSDWAQEGRKKGFGKQQRYAAGMEGQPEGFVGTSEGVPKAPFVTNTKEWVDLSLKNIIKRAVDEGYDRVAFINGEQSANRYDLSKQVDQLLYKKNADGTYELSAQAGGRGNMLGEAISADKLEDYVGKEIAQKIIDGEGKRIEVAGKYDPVSMTSSKDYMQSLSGIDLKVGGEGMKAFYDKLVPERVKAVLKRFGGGEPKVVNITGKKTSSDYGMYYDDRAGNYVVVQNGDDGAREVMRFDFLVDAEEMVGDLNAVNLPKGKGYQQIGFDITPEMRERFQKPIPYKEGGLVTLMKEGGDVMKMANKAIRQSLKPIELPELKMIDAPAEDVDALRRSVMELIGMQPQEVQMAGGGDPRVKLSAEAAKAARKSVAERVGKTLTKVADKSVATQSEIEKEVERSAKRIAKENPKLTYEEAYQKAERDVTAKLRWERIDQPGAVKEFGELEPAPYTASVSQRYRNVPEQVEARAARAEAFLNQPTEPWQPPKPELQAFDRSLIRDALEGFPGVEQTRFPRYQPARANIGYVNEMYDDPRNRELIKKQIKRGLPLGGETFYASLYPLKVAALERGIPAEKFDQFIYEIAPASARNSIMNEMAVGQFLRDMAARGLPLDEQTVTREMANFKSKYGVGLPLMPVHREGVRQVIEGGLNLRDQLKADIPTNYKIPTYGTQKAGDFGKSVVLDVHEAKGETQASPYHPYFSRQGGFGPTEYGTAEGKMLDIAQELGIPGGMAQAGRWFGGGELTGLKSPRGDALDLLEKQQAYTLAGQGIKPTPKNIRKSILDMIETGRGTLMPYFKDEGMPDVRTTKKKGGAVRKSGLSAQTRK